MKILRMAVLVVALFAAPFICKAQSPVVEKLSAATLAVYQGKQVCQWNEELGFFGSEWEWGCEFKSHFTCTATVVDANGSGDYVGLTAGHCFKPEENYYISEEISDQPVLRHIKIEKSENDDRYDFAIFTFSSHKVYPIIEIDLESSSPALATKVLNVNFALGLTKQVVPGQVISNIIIEPIPRSKGTKGRYLVNVGVGPGASGSAIVSENTGKIVGLVEAIFPGTQMPTVVMPTGKTFFNFMEDDSAGLKQGKAEGQPPKEKEQPISEQHTGADLISIAVTGGATALSLFAVALILYKIRKLIKNTVAILVNKLHRKK